MMAEMLRSTAVLIYSVRTALGVAVAALALWSLNIIEPPAVIMGGATAIIIILAAARHRNRADK